MDDVGIAIDIEDSEVRRGGLGGLAMTLDLFYLLMQGWAFVVALCVGSFLNVAISDILDMYVGQSEQNLKDVFAQARASTPSVLFFDEVAGYLPPHPKRPPTKGPLLTMMKQARAMGLGVILATQNPVDVDYKALSNAGLWAIGRLRTQQDRERVLKGLPGEGLHEKVEGLAKRHFLIAQAAGSADVVGTRHAMCYLRGPFTRVEITQLGANGSGAPQLQSAPAVAAASPVVAQVAAPVAAPMTQGCILCPLGLT